jgi:hypothetical protein
MDAPITRFAAITMAQLGKQVFAPSLPAFDKTAPKGQLKEGWILGAGNRPLA